MKLTYILSRLSGVTEDHDGHLALCPAHLDVRHPSLKLTLKSDGQLLMVCRTGCALDDILEKISLPKSALFDVDGQGTKTVSSTAPETVGIAEIAGLKAFVDETAAALADAEDAASYLMRRFGLAADVAADLGIGYAGPANRPQPWLSKGFTRHPRITVPLYDFDGVAKGLQGRDIGGKCTARWMSLTNVPGKVWAKWGYLSAGTGYDAIVVTEGPGDGLTSVGIGYDSLLIRGAALANNPALLAEIVEHLAGRDVIIAFDPDPAGERGTKALAVALTEAGNAPRRLPFPVAGEDLTAWRERDPDAFPAALHAAVRAAEVVVLDAPAPAPPVPAADPTDAALETMEGSARQMFDGTDVGIAVMLRDFMARNGGGVRYARGIGFLVWDGTVWAPGNDKVREALHLLGAELIASGDDSKRRLALKALTNRSIKAVIDELPSVPGVAMRADELDANPELLSVANGTINLRTGAMHAHSPEDLITKRLDVAYRPDAPAERWNKFLTEVFPNHPEMPAFMRRLVGYGITGSTSEHCFAFMHGQGSNGKSAFLDALSYVLKGVTQATQFSTFEKSVSVGQASPELASLRGARMVTASETEKYSRLAEALVKQLTGGDPITCRFLNQNPFTYAPSFLLLVAGNFKPAIMSQDEGTWRRVKLIPFSATFSYALGNKDTTLPAKLRAEAEGILAWAVAGAVEWYANGLGEPASVADATKDYRESEDRLQEWIEACLVQEDGASETPMPIRRAYQEWCEESGMSRKEQLSGWSLGIELESRGYPKRKVKGRWVFAGIRLKTEAEKAAAKRAAEAPADESGGPTDIFGQAKEVAA